MKYKVRGNKAIGYSIAIPTDAFDNAGKPKEYECVETGDGILTYRPVKS